MILVDLRTEQKVTWLFSISGLQNREILQSSVSKSPVLLFLLVDPWWFELGSHPGHPFIHSRALKTCSSPPQSPTASLIIACNGGMQEGRHSGRHWLADRGRGREDEEGGGRQMFESQPWG